MPVLWIKGREQKRENQVGNRANTPELALPDVWEKLADR
jgi:hypothetical protein